MKQTVHIITKDIYLERLLCLLLSEWGLTPSVHRDAPRRTEHDGVHLIDTDSFAHMTVTAYDIVFSRDGLPARLLAHARHLPIPFAHRDLYDMLMSTPTPQAEAEDAPLRLHGRCALLYGKQIALTETEAALLRVLIDAGGDFVSRKTLLSHMKGGKGHDGGLNVYMHYLRKKLEAPGVRMLLCSREKGYRIDQSLLKSPDQKP